MSCGHTHRTWRLSGKINNMNYTLKHLIRKPKTPTKNPALLLMLHGYGSNEQDLFSFASELPDELLIVSAQAPMSMGFGQYAWYTISFGADDSKFSDIPEAIHARDLIIQFIDELQETYHFDPKRSFQYGYKEYYAGHGIVPNNINNFKSWINDILLR